jgi:hypothetical protein
MTTLWLTTFDFDDGLRVAVAVTVMMEVDGVVEEESEGEKIVRLLRVKVELPEQQLWLLPQQYISSGPSLTQWVRNAKLLSLPPAAALHTVFET